MNIIYNYAEQNVIDGMIRSFHFSFQISLYRYTVVSEQAVPAWV
jgi:hypothetical protein